MKSIHLPQCIAILAAILISACGFGQSKALETAFSYYFKNTTDKTKYCQALLYFEKAMQEQELANYPMYYAAQSACQCGETEKAQRYFRQAFSAYIDFYNYSFFANDTLNSCFSKTKEWNDLLTKMKKSYDSVELVRTSFLQSINDTAKRLNNTADYAGWFINVSKDLDVGALIRLIQRTEFKRPPITNHWTLYNLSDKKGERVPFLLYIPSNYIPKTAVPLFVYLHGAVNRKNYSENQNIPEIEKAVLSSLQSRNAFILYPFAKKDFNWIDSVRSLDRIIEEIRFVKRLYNIHDNKVYMGGHSDGARGAFWYSLYNRTPFGGFYAFAFPGSLFVDKTKLLNLQGEQPLISVNGTRDEIFPYASVKSIYDSCKIHRLNWKMYTIDAPHNFMGAFPEIIARTYDTLLHGQRNIKPLRMTIELGNYLPVQNLWLQVTDTFSTKDKLIEASYFNNQFVVSTKGIKSFSILIPYGMVDYSKPLRIVVNGKLERRIVIKPETKFIIHYFLKTADRELIITNEVKVNL